MARNITTTEFSVGDRVRLRADSTESWIDPKMRLRARKGIPATVKTVFGTLKEPRLRSYQIEFDTIPRLDPMITIICVTELEAI